MDVLALAELRVLIFSIQTDPLYIILGHVFTTVPLNHYIYLTTSPKIQDNFKFIVKVQVLND